MGVRSYGLRIAIVISKSSSPDLVRGRHVRRAGDRAEGMRVLVLVIGDDAESTNIKLKVVQLDVLEHDFPLELHDRTRQVQLEQLVWAQAVPYKQVVVFE